MATGHVDAEDAVLPILAGFTTNSVTKAVLAWTSGGRRYALRVLPGLIALCSAFALGLWLA